MKMKLELNDFVFQLKKKDVTKIKFDQTKERGHSRQKNPKNMFN